MIEQSKGAILFSSTGFSEEEWVPRIKAAAPDRDVFSKPNASVQYALLWKHPHGILSDTPNLKVIFSLGAGVDHILTDKTLPKLPIVRAISPDLAMRMSEYVIWQVLDHHRRGAFYRKNQTNEEWSDAGYQPAANAINVGILGLGELGQDAAKKLRTIGYQVSSWSRKQKNIDDVKCFSNEQGLVSFLKDVDILVCLLPHTPETENILNKDLFAKLKKSGPLGPPILINAGRGALQNENDVLSALENGNLGAASLDVFKTEPLPISNPLWRHPNVTVTPHIAADSDPDAMVGKIIEQINNYEAGLPLVDLVDLSQGY